VNTRNYKHLLFIYLLSVYEKGRNSTKGKPVQGTVQNTTTKKKLNTMLYTSNTQKNNYYAMQKQRTTVHIKHKSNTKINNNLFRRHNNRNICRQHGERDYDFQFPDVNGNLVPDKTNTHKLDC